MSGAPRVLVYSSLFPTQADPIAGVFIRERMFRVGRHLPLVVVSPKPWFPGESLIRFFRPRFRPPTPTHEIQQGVHVYAPRFFSPPGLFKSLDSLFMALGSYRLLRRLKREHGFDLIDAHFGYPDGHAASLLGRWLGVPISITLRGSERTYAETPSFRSRIAAGLRQASRVFAVSESLRQLALRLGAAPERTLTIPNAVDSERFRPEDKAEARARLGLSPDGPVIVSVGWLIERKGFHRVIDCLPELIRRHPGLRYLIVGGPCGVEDILDQLHRQVDDLGVRDHVLFTGPRPSEELKWMLSAADLFVLATRREGWANVFLEAMACGLPVITTDVDGNAEVVSAAAYGAITPFGDQKALTEAIDAGLRKDWDREAIRAYALENAWERRVEQLRTELRDMVSPPLRP